MWVRDTSETELLDEFHLLLLLVGGHDDITPVPHEGAGIAWVLRDEYQQVTEWRLLSTELVVVEMGYVQHPQGASIVPLHYRHPRPHYCQLFIPALGYGHVHVVGSL